MTKKIVNNYGSFDVVFTSANGATMRAADGREYIDFIAGIGVNCLGHNFKPLVDAIAAQAAREIHVSNYYLSDAGLAFADRLLRDTGFDGAYFGNSGAEANEAAIKLARKYGFLKGGAERREIVTLDRSFHGRTLAALAATGQDKFHPAMFAPYPAGFRTIKANDWSALDGAFDEKTAAFMVECVQGEGGVNLVDDEWARAAARAARKAGAIVMADEVQTGMGRCGALLASGAMGFEPEVVTLAKGIAGGIPMGACLFRGSANGVFAAGDHQSTFAGNPLACAAGLVVLETLGSDGFYDEVNRKGRMMRARIESWNLPMAPSARGRGLMTGVEIAGAKPFDVEKRCLDNGLCVSCAGESVIRFLPPLNITDDEIEKGLAIFKKTLEEF